MLDDVPSSAPDDPLLARVLSGVAAVRANPRRVAASCAVVALLGIAMWWLLRPPPPIAPEKLLPVVTTTPDGVAVDGQTGTGQSAAAPPSTVVETVVVHVVGGVVHPGVIRLPAGARVVDAIAAAGGESADADTSRINLAAVVVDGGWIHVPRIGEEIPTPPVGASGGATGDSGRPGSGPSGGSSEPIDLNSATIDQLDTLPGVGPATAAAIVEHRTRNGPFTSVDGLTAVPGIGAAKLERIRPLVRV